MIRRAGDSIEDEAIQALLDTVRNLGFDATAEVAPASQTGIDFLFELGGTTFVGEATTVVTAGDAPGLFRRLNRGKRPAIVVADRIARSAKDAFGKAGINYLDRRGELRIVAPPILINTTVPASATGQVAGAPLASQVAKEVAITVLLTPDQPHRVRDTAAFINRAPSAVSRALAGLRRIGLVTSTGEPIVPDLFDELATVWRRESVALAGLPQPRRRTSNDELALGLVDIESTPGWALTDTLAAASWGMPVVARGDYPPDFYVPTTTAFNRALAQFGPAADTSTRACTIALAPARLVCLRRVDHSQSSGEVWPVANHVVVALDLASEQARGREILEQWQPHGIFRAW